MTVIIEDVDILTLLPQEVQKPGIEVNLAEEVKVIHILDGNGLGRLIFTLEVKGIFLSLILPDLKI